jgi:hypothetical protein
MTMEFEPFFPPPPLVYAPPDEQFVHDIDQREAEWGHTFQQPPALTAADPNIDDILALYHDDLAILPSVSTETISEYPYPDTPSQYSGLPNVIEEYGMNEQPYFNGVLRISFGSLPASPSSPTLQMSEASSDDGTNANFQDSFPPLQQSVSPSEITSHGELDGPRLSPPARTHQCPTCGHSKTDTLRIFS